jgi:hypothetical protein
MGAREKIAHSSSGGGVRRGRRLVLASVAVAAVGVPAFLFLSGRFVPNDPSPSQGSSGFSLTSPKTSPAPTPRVQPPAPDPGTMAYIVGQYAAEDWLIDVRTTSPERAEVRAYRVEKGDGGKTRRRAVGKPKGADYYGMFMNFGSLRWDDQGQWLEVHIGTRSTDTFERGQFATHCLCFGMGGDDKIPEGCDAERFRAKDKTKG